MEARLASRAGVWLIAQALSAPLLECVELVQAFSLHPSSPWLDHPTPIWGSLPWEPDFKDFKYHLRPAQNSLHPVSV